MMRRSVLMLLLLVACGAPKSEAELILGRWKVEDAIVFSASGDTGLELETIQLAKSVKYEFRDDFTYVIQSGSNPQGKVGHWKFDPYHGNLELATEGEIQITRVDTLLRDRMELTTTLPGLGNLTMILKRNDN
jgi:hypothetical protein